MLDVQRIDQIRCSIEEGEPHMGAETEGIVTDPSSLEVIHRLGKLQPTQAVKKWIVEQGGPVGREVTEAITPDVPETTVEANPKPLRSPKSTAAAQRLYVILVDTALGALGAPDEPHPQLLQGATWRPPGITPVDASEAADTFKRIYYEFQIRRHGDKIGAAAGDHLNLSAPWMGHPGKSEISRKMIEMTGRMRLIGGALSIGLSASSPLFFGADRSPEPIYGTSLTPWESARLGHVWPGRTIMDVSGLSRDPVSFRRTMRRFAESGTLLSGRDVWLLARAQPGTVKSGQSLDNLCADLNIDPTDEAGRQRLRELLFASFRFGPRDEENDLRFDPQWQKLEAWRQDLLVRVIETPRNRTEIRTLETPPFFEADDNEDCRTPYEYNKAIHAFVELLFIYLSENPSFVDDLEYGEVELQAAKSNEQIVLGHGLDGRVRWIPRNMRSVVARELLGRLLEAMRPLIDGLERQDDIAIIERIVSGEVLPPAARIRHEVGRWCGINPGLRHNAQLLPDDTYPRSLLQRTRKGMTVELSQIEADLPKMPALDQPQVRQLLELVKKLRAVDSEN